MCDSSTGMIQSGVSSVLSENRGSVTRRRSMGQDRNNRCSVQKAIQMKAVKRGSSISCQQIFV